MNGLTKQGWVTVNRWPPPAGRRRVILWPKLSNLRTSPAKVGPVVTDALQQMYEAGRWCVILDDLQALVRTLRIGGMVELLLLNARSVGMSIVTSTQRPRWVPREVWAMSTHVFVWGTADAEDLRALGGLGVAHSKTIRAEVARLPPHDVLYANTRTGRLIRTRVTPGGR